VDEYYYGTGSPELSWIKGRWTSGCLYFVEMLFIMVSVLAGAIIVRILANGLPWSIKDESSIISYYLALFNVSKMTCLCRVRRKTLTQAWCCFCTQLIDFELGQCDIDRRNDDDDDVLAAAAGEAWNVVLGNVVRIRRLGFHLPPRYFTSQSPSVTWQLRITVYDASATTTHLLLEPVLHCDVT